MTASLPVRRAAKAGLILLAAGVLTFGVVAPPERCPSVSAAQLRASATGAADWFVRNQDSDGSWLYLYDAETDAVAADYNVVRHAGAIMGLYQAAAADIPDALESADSGVDWALERLIEQDDWAAVTYRGQTPVGATALLVAGLAQRRESTGDDRYDDLLDQLGGFLVNQTESSGAVLAYYDNGAGEPIPGEYSKYYTGEAYWALALLQNVFPDDGWGEVADRIGTYLATERDDDEGYWIPLPDHWAAYGMAETVTGGRKLDDDHLAYGRRQAELFGSQVRWISQRFGPWGLLVRGPHVPRGGGYGVVGEALGGWWRVAQAEPSMAELRAPLAERVSCIAGLAVREQADSDEAADFAAPERVQGAWFRDGSTRMDDQQHALSAILAAIPVVEPDAADSGDGRPAPSAWLWGLGLLAAMNPVRIARGVPRGEGRHPDVTAATYGRRDMGELAVLGAGIGVLGVLVVAGLAAGPLRDALGVSAPPLRIAAGILGTAVGLTGIVARRPWPEPALPGRRAVLVPVALPFTVGPALVAMSLSAWADRGVLLPAVVLAVGVTLVGASVRWLPLDDSRDAASRPRVTVWIDRLTAVTLAVVSVLLLIGGIFDV